MKTREEIVDIVQENIDANDEYLDFYEYVHGCVDLTEEEKEWADEHLGMHLVVEDIWE